LFKLVLHLWQFPQPAGSNKKTAVAAHTREIMAPPFDAALAAAVKKQEEKTKEKAPYFGAESQDEALQLDAWKRIGEDWGDRAPSTCWNVYTARYPVAGARQVRYDEEAKAAVLSGKRDAELKTAAALCDRFGLSVRQCTHQFVNDVDARTVGKRLEALNYAGSIESWAADLDAELAATKKKYGGLSFFDCDGDACTITRIDFYEDSPTPLVPVAWCAVEGYPGETPVALAEVDDYIAGREPPEPEAPPEPTPLPPPVPAPREPSPALRTRGEKKRAAGTEARSKSMKKTNGKRQKKKAADDAADEAEKKNDVEPDGSAFSDYRPPHEHIEGDTRPTTVNDEALRATIGEASLLDEATVQTPLERCLAPMQMKRPPKDAPVVLPGEVLPCIGEVGWTIQGDRDLTKLTRAVEIITDEIEDACGGSGRRGDAVNHAADVYLDGRHVKVKNNRNSAGCLHVVGPNDGTSSDKSRAFLSYVKRLAAKAHGEDKAALEFFAAQCERWLFTRTLLVELAAYPAGRAGNSHRDDEKEDLKTQHDHRHRGGEAKGFRFAGPVKFRLALSVVGKRSMSFRDTRGWVATIDRSPGRGVCFVDGAHTESRGVVEHRNDAGDAPGATLILTFRADASSAFDDMTPAERLFAHAGIALFAAH
jgi:hypothetical protein